MSLIIEDNSLNNKDLLKNESIFNVANGYIGVRGNFEEGYPGGFETIRGTYINAFYEVNPIQYGEKLYGFPDSKQSIVNVIDSQTMNLYIDGERFSLFEGEVLSFKRTFNLKEGYTQREIQWRSPKGFEFFIKIKRLVSFSVSELFLTYYEIRSVNYGGRLEIVSEISGDVTNYASGDDPRVGSENINILDNIKLYLSGGIGAISAKTKNSGLETACSVYHHIDCPHNMVFSKDEKSIKGRIPAEIAPGGRMTIERYAVYTDSIRHKNPVEEGLRICGESLKKPFSHYFELQKQYLVSFWETSDVVIEGCEPLQQGIRYNIYQLLQSVGKDKHSNISAKGLSGEGYEGHYFWDTEIYIFPFFLLTNPDIARNLLLYRYEILDNARKRARLMGHKKGALYPWRTITGDECSAFFPAGTAQYHINGDIAYSFIKYYQATDDLDFLACCGAEVLFETARLWWDTGHFLDGSFRIDAVTGPDEYTCIVNNNYYTNVMAKYNLKWASIVYKLLKEKHPQKLNGITEKINLSEQEVLDWEKAYKNMYLPYDRERDINPQDDSFLNKKIWDFNNTPKEKYPLLLHYHPLTLYRHQVCKQADVSLAHFLLEDEQGLSTIKNSFDYYEKVTTHDSSLSSCVFSIIASKIGCLEKAYKYFMKSARFDLDDVHSNTKDGIHTANMGGAYLAIVYGFAGLRIKDDGLHMSPTMPKGWGMYSFKIIYKNRRLAISINGKGVHIYLESGESLEIFMEPLQKYITFCPGETKDIYLNN